MKKGWCSCRSLQKRAVGFGEKRKKKEKEKGKNENMEEEEEEKAQQEHPPRGNHLGGRKLFPAERATRS